jgi:hypothetical protein
VCDGRLVSLERPPFWFLPTPAEAVPQELPDADPTVADAELRLDHLADALEGPQLGRVPGGPRASKQHLPEAGLLDRRQPWRAAWSGPGA